MPQGAGEFDRRLECLADRREMLGVIANQVAISLQNGRMVEALEERRPPTG